MLNLWLQDGFGKCRSMIDVYNIIYWVSMLFNGQRTLIFTNDRVLASTAFRVRSLVTYSFLADCTASSVISCWHHAVCPSVCLWCCALWLN